MVVNKKYPFFLWLTTILLAPVLYIIIQSIRSGIANGLTETETIPVFLVLGVLFSLPVFIVFYILFQSLTLKLSSGVLIKWTLNIVVIAGILTSFAILEGSMASMLSLIYISSVIISSAFYKIFKPLGLTGI